MRDYLIKEFLPSEMDGLAKDWQRLEKGQDMTYFQSYDWNKMVISLTPQQKGKYELRLIAVIRGGKSC